MDADLSHDPLVIPRMLGKSKISQGEIVKALRTVVRLGIFGKK